MLQDAFKSLLHSNQEVINRLLVAAEYRDDITGKHVVRVTKYSQLIAEKIGIAGQKLEMIGLTSAMHDIGKIGIPDRILLKPDKLTPEEFEIMKKHTIIGGEILQSSDSPLIKMAQEIALTHHEKWDGTGYPNGLKSDKIVVWGRITAVSDVFDALTSSRPYKKGFPFANAIEIIKNGSGTHFDPGIVDAFMQRIGDVENIFRDYGEQEPKP
jgi:putative two-component system response regulator